MLFAALHSLHLPASRGNHHRALARSRHQLLSTLTQSSSVPPVTLRNSQNVPINSRNPVNNNLPAKTGTYIRQWPIIHAPEVHHKRALRSLRLIKPDFRIKNVRNQQRKYCAQQLDALMKGLNTPLTELITLYQHGFRDLHPYEQTVANLTITARMKQGHPPIPGILADLKKLRALTSQTAKHYAHAANTADSSVLAKEQLSIGLAALEALFTTTPSSSPAPPLPNDGDIVPDGNLSSPSNQNLAQALNSLLDIHRDLKNIPVIELWLPTVVLVGAPNVGKSSIVREISSGTPEVNDYPFTTRGVTIGHIFEHDSMDRSTDGETESNDQLHDSAVVPATKPTVVVKENDDIYLGNDFMNDDIDLYTGKKTHAPKKSKKKDSSAKSKGERYQVMDTPGLLDRPEEERNEMERLTYASLAHLPTGVVFVIDPTGLSGEQSTLEKQLRVRQHLKGRFPKRPWLDVVSKGDIGITSEQQALLAQYGVENPLSVSVKTKTNLTVLRRHVQGMLKTLKEVLASQKFA